MTAAVLAGGSQAMAANFDVNVHIGKPGDQLVVKGQIDLKPGERARTLGIVDGDINIPRGAVVTGDVFSVDGTVRIAGTVKGRVVTLGGQAILAPSAVVGDGIRYASDAPVVASGAQVDGGTDKLDSNVGNALPWVAWFIWWLAVSLSTLLLGVLALWIAPRAADATSRRIGDGGWGPAIGVGAVLVIGLPVLAFLALVTLVGIPFGIGLLLALLPLGALGYVASAWLLGRRLVGEPRSRMLAFLAGWAILRLIGLLPFVGALVFLAALVFGLGALGWATLQARGGPGTPVPAGGPESPTMPTI